MAFTSSSDRRRAVRAPVMDVHSATPGRIPSRRRRQGSGVPPSRTWVPTRACKDYPSVSSITSPRLPLPPLGTASFVSAQNLRRADLSAIAFLCALKNSRFYPDLGVISSYAMRNSIPDPAMALQLCCSASLYNLYRSSRSTFRSEGCMGHQTQLGQFVAETQWSSSRSANSSRSCVSRTLVVKLAGSLRPECSNARTW